MKLVVKNARYKYPHGDYVLNGISFDAKPQDIVCILGPNGCGKTTLLKCILGFYQLNEGKIRIGNKDISEYRRIDLARIFAMIPQEHHSVFPFTVRDIVLMGRAPYIGFLSYPAQKDIRIADEAINTVGISHLTEKLYTNISGGERQLTLIARALAQEPKILILDEPTSNLDIKNQMLCLNILRRLANERKISVVMSTHYPDQALLVSSNVLLMNQGKIVAWGDQENVITESNIEKTYGINVKILSETGENNHTFKSVVPIGHDLY